MPSPETHQNQRNVYDACDPQYLRELREAAGMDVVVLAKTACLSVAQVRQLESDARDNLFYSDAIKRQAYKRLLMILGAEPPSVDIPEELKDSGKVAQAHLDTLDQIVAMSHQPSMNRSAKDVLFDAWTLLNHHKQAILASLFLLAAVGLFVLSPPISKTEAEPSKQVAPSVALNSVASNSTAETLTRGADNSSAASAATETAVITAQTASHEVATPAQAQTSKSSGCSYTTDAMPELTSAFPQKETRYVYLLATSNTDLCVVDGNQQATLLQLKSGEGRSVYGPAPWQISGTQLQKVQVFFQGARVSVPDSVAHHFRLTEVSIAR